MQSFNGERTWQHTKDFFSLLPFKLSAPLTKKVISKAAGIFGLFALFYLYFWQLNSQSFNFQLLMVDNYSFQSQKATRWKTSSLSPAISQKEWVVFPCRSVILWTSAMNTIIELLVVEICASMCQIRSWWVDCEPSQRKSDNSISLFSRNPLTFSSARCLLLSIDADRN